MPGRKDCQPSEWANLNVKCFKQFKGGFFISENKIEPLYIKICHTCLIKFFQFPSHTKAKVNDHDVPVNTGLFFFQPPYTPFIYRPEGSRKFFKTGGTPIIDKIVKIIVLHYHKTDIQQFGKITDLLEQTAPRVREQIRKISGVAIDI